MYGRKSRMSLLLFSGLLLLFLSPSYGQPVYDGPDLPEGWYPIHETELTTLGELLTGQDAQLTTLETTLTLASESLETSGKELETARVSLNELGRAAGRLRSLCILLGVTTAGGVLFILFSILGTPMVIGD